MPRKKSSRLNLVAISVPNWATKTYLALAVVLIPWTVYLGLSLPKHHLSAHWDISWTGLDIGLVISFLATGFLAYKRSALVVSAASTTGSLLLVDAWFDVMSEHSGALFHQALGAALFLEIPLALMSYYLAFHTLKRNIVKR